MINLVFPEAASTFATAFDNFSVFLIVLCGTVTLAIYAVIFFFIARYHHEHGAAEAFPFKHPSYIEYAWTIIPFGIFVFMFWWGAHVYMMMESVPQTGLPVFVLGKQWMWEFEHSGGQREINELHVPVDRAVRLTMISQDVIHSFFIPAFRIKQDLLPGRYTYTWFKATKPGRYRILCTELCGTNHSEMTGMVEVMSAGDYSKWLEKNASIAKADTSDTGSLVELGRHVFESRQCASCHSKEGAAPSLIGLKASENEILESILRPSAKITPGYPDIMPSFQGQLTERELRGLVDYIETLK